MPVWVTDEETLGLTQAAIESIKVAPVKLIVIDNGSTHGGGALREWADLYVRNKENLGYAKAVNQGLRLAERYVVIANNDIVVSPNWYDVVMSEATSNSSLHFRMIPYGEDFSYGVDTWKTGKERWCSSSFFFMRNGQQYDENFLNSYDDYDFWARWRGDGRHQTYTNRACYKHKDSHTQQKIADRSERDKRNYEYYKERWGEYPDVQFARMFPEQMERQWKPFF
jgi:glycosyltransferase involved in cell wall biosynthesis